MLDLNFGVTSIRTQCRY